MDKDLRRWLEDNIEYILKNPNQTEEIFSIVIKMMAIEKGVDAIISFLVGWLMGCAETTFFSKYTRSISVNERTEVLELLQRRAREIREAFMSTRIK